ncbi:MULTISPECIES: alpha/beta hydrolase [unclassified Janibacter]|uniref:alpha/beta hydrolase n=1 Tax=unclassified Janibacter TaxID=2649294 RepID=UPI003D056E87
MRSRSAAFAVLTATALALSGCSLMEDLTGDAPTPLPSGDTSAPAGTRGLETFYEQDLTWSDCLGGQCAEMTVPLDYEDPTGETISISVLKAPAVSAGKRIGSLIVNPGGPGGSGVDYAAAADQIVSARVRDRFDVVGFDPRGVGRSEPVDCLDDTALDVYLGADPTPDDAAEEKEFAANARTFAQGCDEKSGDLLTHVSTVEAAKDMDVLRAVLGDSQLTYLGKSYGTFLGATYAELFPERVGRLVLDGALAPDLTGEEFNLGQATGFETATRAWAQACIDAGDCPLGDSVDAVMTGLSELLTGLDEKPIETNDGTMLTEGWASMGIASMMYDEGRWDYLTEGIRSLENGDPEPLMDYGRQYAYRNDDGTYSSNIMEVISAVNCLDRPEDADLTKRRAQAERISEEAPVWGDFLSWSSLVCGEWPVKGEQAPRKISAKGAAPIVVIGTTRDPATPYAWAQRLAEQLDEGRLITFDGDGHTAYLRSNDCVDKAVDDYLLRGTAPKDGLRC